MSSASKLEAMSKADAKPAGFKVGDRVTWTSQAAGSTKTKVGEVLAVIPPNGGRDALHKYGLSSMNSSRNHESYIVKVPTPSGRSFTAYWPIVSKLRKAT